MSKLRTDYEKETGKKIEYHREGAMSYHHCIEYIDYLEKKLEEAERVNRRNNTPSESQKFPRWNGKEWIGHE